MLRSRRYDYDAIRLGIALYGLAPSSEIDLLTGMKPALRLISKIARISELQPGERVSYGGTYQADVAERIALIPCGYADGFRRSLSNRGWVAIGDARLPIRGRVCMDQLMVGLPDDLEVSVGDEVSLIGIGDDAAPTATELAAQIGTINYEVGTSLATRVPRVYLKNGHIVGIDDLNGIVDLATTDQQSRNR
jgi:alanine racemase